MGNVIQFPHKKRRRSGTQRRQSPNNKPRQYDDCPFDLVDYCADCGKRYTSSRQRVSDGTLPYMGRKYPCGFCGPCAASGIHIGATPKRKAGR